MYILQELLINIPIGIRFTIKNGVDVFIRETCSYRFDNIYCTSLLMLGMSYSL